MKEKKAGRRILMGVLAVAVIAGIAGRRAVVRGGDAEAPIVEADEELRDAVASPVPAMPPPSMVAPSRVAVWASPTMRHAEAEKILLSRRLNRASSRRGPHPLN